MKRRKKIVYELNNKQMCKMSLNSQGIYYATTVFSTHAVIFFVLKIINSAILFLLFFLTCVTYINIEIILQQLS